MPIAYVTNGEIYVCDNCGVNVLVEHEGTVCPKCGCHLTKEKDSYDQKKLSSVFSEIAEKKVKNENKPLAPIVSMFGTR